ncbi:C-reactive protein-like [Melanotaenia boesemani]|uniref:C-reactive protein-like n=1 Tax=Melanotaenia boesemani TaxID=1250792 RepID=UPI001C051F3A|nr:C-reactive protein-like [Melanotaenia boesemani]
MELLLLLVTLTSCAAIPQNLVNKMFTFPQESATAHVRLTTSRQDLRAVTVCLRTFSDIKRDQAFFSLATPSKTNDFLIFKLGVADKFNLHVRDKYAAVEGHDWKLNTWHSVCVTWDAASGLVQLWLDGKPSSRKFVSSGSNINGPFIIVLGQDQDTFGGGFDTKQSFVGMMTDVHMWDYTLSPCEIQRHADGLIFNSGNVLKWESLEFQANGKVLIEEKQNRCCCNANTNFV